MKFSLYLLLLIFPNLLLSQDCELPVNEGKYEIKTVTNLDSIAQVKIYNSALISLAELFKNSKEVIEYKNEKEGVIISKFIVETVHLGMGPKKHFFKFQLRLEFKEGKYRTIISYLNHNAIWTSANMSCSCSNNITEDKCGTSMCISKKEWEIQKCKANTEIQNLLLELNKKIKANLESLNNNDDW